MDTLFGPNPERYAAAKKIHENSTAAHAAGEAFLRDLQDLRIKHGVPEVDILIGVYFMDGDVEMIDSCTSSFGNVRSGVK